MKKILLVIIFLHLTLTSGYCDKDIFFSFDYSVFNGEEGKSILEIYYSVNQQSLKYQKEDNEFTAAAMVEITITDAASNTPVFSNIYKSPSIVTDTSKEKIGQKLIGQVNYLLDKGKYRLSIVGSDFNDSASKDSFQQEFEIGGSSGAESVSFSDIELSSSIQKSQETQSPFYKNTLLIVPNPSGLYGMNLNELYYYVEIYGLTSQNVSDKYNLNYSVTDLNNQKVISFVKTQERKTESKADYGKFLIDSLTRGSYIFKVELVDSAKKLNLSVQKNFYIYNTSHVNNVTMANPDDYLKSEYPAMSENDVTKEYKKMVYILNSQEIKRYGSLTALNDKRKFLYDFWKSKDQNPATQVLETKIAYMKRVAEANELYKEAYTEGWKSDRGRIYIIYGKPDDVERHPFESQSKSYEVWKYDSVEGGGECAFVEIQQSTGVYDLVHSTFRNELKNPTWNESLNSYK